MLLPFQGPRCVAGPALLQLLPWARGGAAWVSSKFGSCCNSTKTCSEHPPSSSNHMNWIRKMVFLSNLSFFEPFISSWSLPSCHRSWEQKQPYQKDFFLSRHCSSRIPRGSDREGETPAKKDTALSPPIPMVSPWTEPLLYHRRDVNYIIQNYFEMVDNQILTRFLLPKNIILFVIFLYY